jgi:Zn-dependent membrane protease YugP
MFIGFDPMYFLFLAPAILLGLWAQMRVKSTFAEAERVPARLSGAAAARHVLDAAGLSHVGIEQTDGFLSDHYDPRHKVLRLSPQVYQGASMAAVGVAAHEAGHAMQDARNYAPLAIRNAAVPAANFGSGISWVLIMLGMFLSYKLVWLGIAAFGCVVFFQLVNLPVEFDASSRAKEQLAYLGIVGWPEQKYVSKVLNAAAWTYVAATLQAILTLLYFIVRFGGIGHSDD